MPIDFEDPTAKTAVVRRVLMLCDRWSDWSSGRAVINQMLAVGLCGYGGVEVYSTVMEWHALGHVEDMYTKEDNFTNPVKLIRFDVAQGSGESGDVLSLIRSVYTEFDNSPLPMLRTSVEPLPNYVDVIVGHSLVSSSAALRLRDQLYPNSKVILIYHVIPDELEWARDHISVPMPDVQSMIANAQRADVVYSVSYNVYDYFKAKFRRQSHSKIDHRLLLPQASASTFVFELPPYPTDNTVPVYHVVAPCTGSCLEDWMGLDIAVCAVGKVAAIMSERAKNSGVDGDAMPLITLTVINVHASHVADARLYLRRETEIAEAAGAKIVVKEMSSLRSGDHDRALYELSQKRYVVSLLPFRAEPQGFVTLKAHSCGIPCLIPSHASTAPLISRLVTEPEYFIAPVTRDVAAVKTDATIWASRVVSILDNLSHVEQLAGQLKHDLRTDELTRQTHDNFYSECLGGIGLKFEVTDLRFVDPPDCKDGLDGPRDLDTRRRFNRFLMGALRQGWRMKRHPLQTEHDLRPLISSIPRLPMSDLISRVIDVVEDRHRRIVDIDCDTNSLVVYCGDVDSLQDLWAMCDHINVALRSVLLPKKHPSTIPLLVEFRLRKAVTRVSMSGPQLLSYKQHLVDMRDQHNVSDTDL